MKNNFLIWELNYRDVLNEYYENFCNFLTNHGEEEEVSYNEFSLFIYQNTKKSIVYLPGVISKEIHALVI